MHYYFPLYTAQKAKTHLVRKLWKLSQDHASQFVSAAKQTGVMVYSDCEVGPPRFGGF